MQGFPRILFVGGVAIAKTIMTANSNSVGLIRPPAAAALGGVYMICLHDIRRVAQPVAPISQIRGA
jgi:hypothetical protein